jgi:hypothetical protein
MVVDDIVSALKDDVARRIVIIVKILTFSAWEVRTLNLASVTIENIAPGLALKPGGTGISLKSDSRVGWRRSDQHLKPSKFRI